MLKYLIIPITRSAVSFCHYERDIDHDAIISLADMKAAIFWAMKLNLNIQFVYPDYKLPEEYISLINTVDHVSIVGSACKDTYLLESADIVVFDSLEAIKCFPFNTSKEYVIRTSKEDFFENARNISRLLNQVNRLVVIITDPVTFTENDFRKYEDILHSLIPKVAEEYAKGHYIHFNLLTDRILLEDMNNCNAGYENITLAPDGRFYICPAFYIENLEAVGNLKKGLSIKNHELYKLDHAPICSICDAFQCRRCVWLNKHTTREVNTPSYEQCVMAHIERNASIKLIQALKEDYKVHVIKNIPEIDYLDPLTQLTK